MWDLAPHQTSRPTATSLSSSRTSRRASGQV